MVQEKLLTDYETPITAEWRDFAGYLADLLGARPLFWQPPAQMAWLEAACLCRVSQSDKLLLVQIVEQSWSRRLLRQNVPRHFASRPHLPVLVTRELRWPLRRLLLVLRDERVDKAATAWLLRLAEASRAAVTILPVVPSLPVLYRLGNRGQPELAVLLAPNTPIGSKIWRVAAALKRAGIHSLVRQRRGTPDQQIREEVAAGDYDLIVIGAENGGRFYRWFVGELVPSLLRWCDRSVLITNVVEGAS